MSPPVGPHFSSAPIQTDGNRPALRCLSLTKRFGGVAAVDDVSLTIGGPGVYGLCGANGAGKSTLFNLVAGAVHSDGGQVWLKGVEVTAFTATQRARLGLARTWQAVQLLEGRTVLDNVALTCVHSIRRPLWRVVVASDYVSARDRAGVLLDDLGLGSLAGRKAGELTLEAQRMVEVARALAREPVVLLADEPASGLSSGQRSTLAALLVDIARERPVLVVEHDLAMLTGISDRIYAMAQGQLVFDGEPDAFVASSVYRSLRGLASEAG